MGEPCMFVHACAEPCIVGGMHEKLRNPCRHVCRHGFSCIPPGNAWNDERSHALPETCMRTRATHACILHAWVSPMHVSDNAWITPMHARTCMGFLGNFVKLPRKVLDVSMNSRDILGNSPCISPTMHGFHPCMHEHAWDF